MHFKKNRGITRIAIVLIIVVIIAVGAAASYYFLLPGAPPKTPSEINIGAVLSLTGFNSAPGADDKIGLNYWVQHVNSQGGLYMSAYNKKIPLNLIILDDKSDPSSDTTLLQQLVTQYNVTALVSETSFANAFVIIPFVERNAVPYVSLFDFYNSTWNLYSSIVPQPKYTFWVWPNFASVASVFWNWYDTQPVGQKPTSVAAVAASIPGFNINAAQFLAGAQSKGLNVTLPLQTYDVASTDLTSLVLKLKAANPDVVYAMSLVQDGVLLVKQANQLGFHPKLWIMPATAEFNQLNQALGPLVNGIISPTTWNRLLPYNLSSDLNTYYMNQTGGLPGTALAGNNVAAFQVLTDAIQRAGSINKTAITNALATTNIDTIEGHVQFDSNHNSYTLQTIIIQWQNQAQQIVWPTNLKTSTMQYPMPT